MKEKCHICEKELSYDEIEDSVNNEVIPKKIRKVVIDGDKSFPLFSIPPDKRRLIDDKIIKFECAECSKKRVAE